MSNLRIELIGLSGLLKTWLAKPQDEALNIGSSRYADVRVPALSKEKNNRTDSTETSQVNGLEARIEFSNNAWSIIYLQASKNTEIQSNIDEDTVLNLGVWKIRFTRCEKQISVINDLQAIHGLSLNSTNSSKLKAYHLILISKDKRLLHTYAVPKGEAFKTQLGEFAINQKFDEKSDWQEQILGPYSLSNRLIYVDPKDVEPLLKKEKLTDKNGLRILQGTFATGLLLFMMYMLLGETRSVEEIASAPPPKQPVYREVQLKLKQKSSQAIQAQQQNESSERSAVAQNTPSATGRRGLFAKSRITQLIGKISSTSAREEKVAIIAQQGNRQVASNERSVNSIEGIGGGGKSWKGEGPGSGASNGTRIGTSGIGGGGSANGFGKIAGGKAGSGDVGLVEEDAEVAGGLDREVIAAYIRSKLGEILYCYERQLSAEPNLFGKVAVKFVIGSSGSLASQKIGESTLRNAGVEGCILNKVANWKFPAPRGGTQVVVTYPFLFKSTN